CQFKLLRREVVERRREPELELSEPTSLKLVSGPQQELIQHEQIVVPTEILLQALQVRVHLSVGRTQQRREQLDGIAQPLDVYPHGVQLLTKPGRPGVA